MKYIDSEKLIAEIEGLLKLAQNKEENEGDFFFSGEIQGYKNIITIIASLQQEQPEVDLEKTIEAYFKGWHIEEEIGLTKPDGWSCIVDDLKDVARHFYELGLIARGNE